MALCRLRCCTNKHTPKYHESKGIARFQQICLRSPVKTFAFYVISQTTGIVQHLFVVLPITLHKLARISSRSRRILSFGWNCRDLQGFAGICGLAILEFPKPSSCPTNGPRSEPHPTLYSAWEVQRTLTLTNEFRLTHCGYFGDHNQPGFASPQAGRP